jgi:LysR family transcriptional regulator, glycine cleavage system transcriptional activator
MYGSAMVSRAASGSRRRPVGLAPLRGFEAAARLLSFTLAADELKLTQSSISRQIAALEHQIGKALFVRRTRALELTAAGTQLQRAVRQALNAVDLCVDEIRGASGQRRVTLTTYASFASLWLAPRLAQFQRDHPGIEIRLDASDRAVDLQAEDVDLAIRWVPPGPLPPGAVVLVEDMVTAAISPRLLPATPLRRPAELARWPLLDLDEVVRGAQLLNWATWFEFAGAGPVEPTAGRLVFSFVDQAVHAAVRGQGVALVRSPFLQDYVASGDLVMPFPGLLMPSGYRHVLIRHPQAGRRPQVAAFLDWLLEQFRLAPQLEG